MIRKIVMGLGLVAVGSYLWMGTSAGSYVKTGYRQFASYFEGQVPVEFEIQRARQMLDDLSPEVRNAMKSIAEEEVRIARLRREIDRTRTNLDEEKVAILKLRDQLGKGLASYTFGSQTYSARSLETELNRRFNSYKRVEGTLVSKQETLTAREALLLAARDKYEQLAIAKDRLETEVANLEARHKMIEAKQVANRFTIDDSQLARVRGLIDDIADRLAVQSKLAEEEGNLIKRIPVDEINSEDLATQIDGYFGSAPASSQQAL